MYLVHNSYLQILSLFLRFNSENLNEVIMKILFTTIILFLSLNSFASDYYNCDLMKETLMSNNKTYTEELKDWVFRADKDRLIEYEIPNTGFKLTLSSDDAWYTAVSFRLSRAGLNAYNKLIDIEPILSGQTKSVSEFYYLNSTEKIIFKCKKLDKEELIYKMAVFLDENHGLKL